MDHNQFSAVVIGGGFYGSLIATYLKKAKGFEKVLLLEKESDIMTRASSNNQARIHNGYHYPRSIMTANSSHSNFYRFINQWSTSVKKNFINIYAIAKNNSKISSRQFKRFCKEINIPTINANKHYRKLFNLNLVSDIFLTDEFVFDCDKFKELVLKELKENHVQLSLNSKVCSIYFENEKKICLDFLSKGNTETVTSEYVFNCTYSSLNHIDKKKIKTKTLLRHEIAEIALIECPPQLKDIGVTLMDGPFFSSLPFPKKNIHSLSHVRYTPHYQWIDDVEIDPNNILRNFQKHSHVNRMIRDASRYLPLMGKSRHVDSFYEIKTILSKNDNDDGRPILFEGSKNIKGLYSILGGKLDNIYDILVKVNDILTK